ncbi:MAG: hypothetical protein HZY75_10770 [Nocardioidaceae bacterium]|nr:MAG: hypothetical protein HZY75_10770 [Nocardioidaceae bacterium]
MGNVSLPTPVALAVGALCLVGGYLVGTVAGPDAPDRTTAEVVSYDAATQQLCLGGEGVEGHPGVADGQLCGVWRRSAGSVTPKPGDDFRFVSMVSSSGSDSAVNIYGDVSRKS